jgi:hypothetical protein
MSELRCLKVTPPGDLAGARTELERAMEISRPPSAPTTPPWRSELNQASVY